VTTFIAVLGGVASAIAVVTGLAALSRVWRRRRQRDQLRAIVERLQELGEKVKLTAVDIDHCHSGGVGWTGWAIWPAPLGPLIESLERVIEESAALTAQARGLAADQTIERLRADVEYATRWLRDAANRYKDGTIANYRRYEGEPIPPGMTGRDTTAALTAEDGGALEEFRWNFSLLIATCLYQLKDEAAARVYNVAWPILRWEIYNLDPEWTPPPPKEAQRPAPPIGEGY
jgi:hypothetical protein